MPRDANGAYFPPPNTEATSGQPISSSKFNVWRADIVAEQNGPRPLSAGGTGATSAPDARANMGLGVAATKGVSSARDSDSEGTLATSKALKDHISADDHAGVYAKPADVTAVADSITALEAATNDKLAALGGKISEYRMISSAQIATVGGSVWTDLALNTTRRDDSGASRAGGVVTLPAGKWRLRAEQAFIYCGRCTLRLFDAGGAAPLVESVQGMSYSGGGSVTAAVPLSVEAIVDVPDGATKDIKAQYRAVGGYAGGLLYSPYADATATILTVERLA